jgi:hypothetical protein
MKVGGEDENFRPEMDEREVNMKYGCLVVFKHKATQGDIPLRSMKTSLRSRLSRMPHGRNIKEKRKKLEMETSLSTAAVIKLGTQPSPPPRPMTHTTREPTPTHTTHTTRNTEHTGVKQNSICFMQKGTQHTGVFVRVVCALKRLFTSFSQTPGMI